VNQGVIARQEFIQAENDYNLSKERMRLSKQILKQDSLRSVKQEGSP
jgi:HlyD family secretion protein